MGLLQAPRTEQAFQEAWPEVAKRLLQVDGGAAVVEPQVAVELAGGGRSLRVQPAGGAAQPVLQEGFRAVQQLCKVPWEGGDTRTSVPPPKRKLFTGAMKAHAHCHTNKHADHF